MNLISQLTEKSHNLSDAFLINSDGELSIQQVIDSSHDHLENISEGDVVAIIGDFEAQSILNLLVLIDKKAVVVPLTVETKAEHEYFFEVAEVDWVVEGQQIKRIQRSTPHHELITELFRRKTPGLILFSTGTTGRPKAILHDMSQFLARFTTPRPALRTLGFLLFDHIGGLNTLLHTMFNSGLVISVSDRSPGNVLTTCEKYEVEVLPTTPTFLRMLLMSGLIPERVPESLKIITYGTERMDQGTLDALADLLPNVDFRQTYGMSELGILRVKSKARNSLYMKVGGEGVETRVVDQVLEILSPNRMLGYLNAPSPFDDQGWYNTKDLIDTDGDYIKIIGRTSEVINVGGLKFLASEVERVALEFDQIEMVKVSARPNPVTGEHVEILIQVADEKTFNLGAYKSHLEGTLPSHMVPRRIKYGQVDVGHRFKKK